MDGCRLAQAAWIWAFAGLCVCVGICCQWAGWGSMCVYVYSATLISCISTPPALVNPFLSSYEMVPQRVCVCVCVSESVLARALMTMPSSGLHNILVSPTERRAVNTELEYCRASSCSGLSPEQPEEKQGQIGKSLSGPFVSVAPPHSDFLPLSCSALNATLPHIIQSGLWPQMQTQEQCLHPRRGNVMSSSPFLIFSCRSFFAFYKLIQVCMLSLCSYYSLFEKAMQHVLVTL